MMIAGPAAWNAPIPSTLAIPTIISMPESNLFDTGGAIEGFRLTVTRESESPMVPAMFSNRPLTARPRIFDTSTESWQIIYDTLIRTAPIISFGNIFLIP